MVIAIGFPPRNGLPPGIWRSAIDCRHNIENLSGLGKLRKHRDLVQD
jgi:hypothetical protein